MFLDLTLQDEINVFCWVFVTPGPWPFAWPPALASGLGPQFVFTSPVPQFVFTSPGSQMYLSILAPNLYLPALAYNFITSPRPEFAYTNPVSSICIRIYGAGLQFVLRVRGLNLHLPRYW